MTNPPGPAMTSPREIDLLGEKPENARRRHARLIAKIEAPFIRNEYGLWCPQCGEQIADWEWIGDCDCCGYPREREHDDLDDMHDDAPAPPVSDTGERG